MSYIKQIQLGSMLLFALAPASSGCRKQDTLAPVELEVAAELEDTDTAAYRPPWTDVAKVQANSGVLIHWLHEKEAERVHVRVGLPTLASEDLDAARVALLGQALVDELRQRIKSYGAEARLRAAPGRIELVIFADHEHTNSVLRQLARSLEGERGQPGKALLRRMTRLQGSFVANYKKPALEHSVAQVTADLLGLSKASQWGSLEQLTSLGEAEFKKAFAALTDPGRAWIIVHSRHTPEQREALSNKLSEAWPARRRREQQIPGLIDRLARPQPDAQAGRRRVLARGGKTRKRRTDAATPANESLLEFIEAEDEQGRAQDELPRPVLVVSRRLKLKDPTSRCRARLAQRILQEHFDARLVISGSLGIFSLRLRLPRKNPSEMLSTVITAYEGEVAHEHSTSRLRQAAKLYLGARMVEASLNDEDWTQLWTQAIDLAAVDEEIPSALHEESECMLRVEPSDQAAWQREELSLAKEPASWRWILLHSIEEQRPGLRAYWPEPIELEENQDESQASAPKAAKPTSTKTK